VQLEQEFLTPEQIAERLAVSVDTVYRLVRDGELAAVRAGRRYTVPVDALREFLERASTDDDERVYHRALELGRLYVAKAQTDGVDAYFDLAEAKLRVAVALRPRDALARYELLRALVYAGRDDQAEGAFRELEACQSSARRRLRRERSLPAM